MLVLLLLFTLVYVGKKRMLRLLETSKYSMSKTSCFYVANSLLYIMDKTYWTLSKYMLCAKTILLFYSS